MKVVSSKRREEQLCVIEYFDAHSCCYVYFDAHSCCYVYFDAYSYSDEFCVLRCEALIWRLRGMSGVVCPVSCVLCFAALEWMR